MTAFRSTGRNTFFLIDACPLIRRGLRGVIEGAEWRVVGEAPAVKSALPLVAESRPDVVVLDVHWDAGSGTECVRQLQAADPGLWILAVANHEERVCAESCLDAGALGYVSKAEPTAVLLEALEYALAGKVYLSDEMKSIAFARVTKGRPPLAMLEVLTPREREVYSMIGAGQSVKQIAVALHLSPKTVEYHRQQLKLKLQLGSSAALARHAFAHQTGVEHADEN